MALIRKKKYKRRALGTYNNTSSEYCYKDETPFQCQKVLDNSTISNEYQQLHFSAEELATLLKKYGLDSFDWSSMV